MVPALCLIATMVPASASAASWEQHGVVLDGEQIDAVAADGAIHVVAKRYTQLDRDVNVVVQEDVGEPDQEVVWALLFAPAIAASPDGTVHLTTRHPTGAINDGYFDLRYRRRAPSGTWSHDYVYKGPSQWNWNVGVADDGNGDAVLLASDNAGGDNVWADLWLFNENDGSATQAGALSGVYRADYEARLRGRGGRVYLATSNAFQSSSTYFGHAAGDAPDLVGELQANMQELSAGTGSEKGFPDMTFDGQGNVHLTYGSGHTNHAFFPAPEGSVPGEVHYAKFDPNGQRLLGDDQTLFTDLGLWHLSIGLSAIGASDDGQTVVAVALRSSGDKVASDSELLWTASTDAGATWTVPEELGATTFGGEGRQRPRLVALGSKFFLFYKAQSTIGYSLATIDFPEQVPAAPASLTAMADASGITVCWQDNASSEEGFAIERKDAGAFAEIASAPADTTCYLDANVNGGTTYTYRVRAFAEEVYSAYSNEASATASTNGGTDGGGSETGSDGGAGSDDSTGGGDDTGSSDSGGVGLSGGTIDDTAHGENEGCGCRTPPNEGGSFGLFALMLLGVRRRRGAL